MKLGRYSSVRRILRLLSLTLLTAALSGCGGYTTSTAPEGGYVQHPSGGLQEAMLERWGVRVLGVRTTADGYMLDFRYRVVDAEKAAPLLDRRIKAQLVVEKSDARMTVPVSSKVGALRQTTRSVKAERNYFVMFANPARHVQPGDRVQVVIGDFSSGSLVVM